MAYKFSEIPKCQLDVFCLDLWYIDMSYDDWLEETVNDDSTFEEWYYKERAIPNERIPLELFRELTKTKIGGRGSN